MISELIKNRRTIHQYKTTPIDNELLTKAIELALYAPNHKNTQPWRFFKLGASSRKRIAELAIALKSAKQEISEAVVEATRAKFLDPAEVIVLTRKYTENEFQAKEDYASLACAVQNMSLFLWDQKIGTKWSTGPVTKSDLVYELINRSPNEVALEGFFWVGYPEKIGPIPPKAALANCYFDIKN